MNARVVIAEDAALFRAGLARLIEDHGHRLCAAVGDGDALLAAVAEHQPDVVVADIRMPPTHTDEGLRAALEIRRRHPRIGVLVLSQYIETKYTARLLAGNAAGAGYLLKERVADVAEFADALERVAAGGTALDPEVVGQLLRASRRPDGLAALTGRERHVLALMAEGRSNAGIAGALVVTGGTVEKHVASIFDKLELPPDEADNRRVLAVLRYLGAQLLLSIWIACCHTPEGSADVADNSGVLHAGPAGSSELAEQLRQTVENMTEWMAGYGDFAPHPSLDVPLDQLRRATATLQERLRENYPFFHPRYVGQMLKPPHPAAVIGYVSAMLINPNNHALDGGPATARMEKEVVAQLAAMFGFSAHLGHLTSSGTIANLEALFVARQIHPGKAVAHSADAHYTHGRMCHVLGVEAVAVPTAADGTMDLQALEETLRGGRIGTVVATPGTTGLGAVDPVHEIVALCRRYGARVHADAAYGGFFRLIADGTAEGVPAEPFAAIADCDSVVIDPHKHGLQPYGCGAVLFRDPGVARHYLHDSPYTYFTSDELHLGEISLECSRAGAAAAALWLTVQLLPLTPAGLGAVLRPGRRAALAWADLIDTSDELALFQRPHLDILSYFPARRSLSEIDRASAHVLNAGMRQPAARSLFVATYTVDSASLAARGHQVTADVASGRILRSVLMKPETEQHVPALHQQVLDLLAGS